MSKLSKILLGIATAWPFLYILLFLSFIFSMSFLMPHEGTSAGGPLVRIETRIAPLIR